MIFAGLYLNWTTENSKGHFYLMVNRTQEGGSTFFIQLLVFWVAYSHMIPISLYVIIEILKLGQASFINKDIYMYDSETKSYAAARNSDLIEELG
jgi:magnesium-transporting ATPase (P-type)